MRPSDAAPPSPPAGSGVGGDGLDLPRLTQALQTAGHRVLTPLTGSRLNGGLSNLTYRIRGRIRPAPGTLADEGDDWVLRRPPLGHVLQTAHDMTREYRALSVFSTTDVPVPRPLVLFEDPAVLGASAYLMSRVEGTVLAAHHDGAALTPEQRGAASTSLITTLAMLHAVPPGPLITNGRDPGDFVSRQVRRWRRQWDESLPEPERESLFSRVNDRLTRWAEALPKSTPTPVHGDYRFDNCVLDADMRVGAVLDWEMSAVGDPLCDLGMLLVYWSDPGDGAWSQIGLAERVTDHPGFPTRREVTNRYALLTGRDTTDIAMYTVLGYYKLAAILQGIHVRHRLGLTVGKGFGRLGSRVPHLLTLALERADHEI